MKSAALFAMLAAPAVAAIAPDSIADTILYRWNTGSFYDYWVVEFRSDGRYLFLYSASGNPTQDYNPVAMGPVRSDGTYTYQRKDDTGVITARGDDGSTWALEVPFSTPTSGSRHFGPANDTTYDFSSATTVRMQRPAHTAVRGRVSPGRPLIIGINSPTRNFGNRGFVLVRVVGPTLANFGVTDVWKDPQFEIVNVGPPYAGLPITEVQYDDWNPGKIGSREDPGPALSKLFEYIGTFPLLSASKDAAGVFWLRGTTYTVMCSTKPGDPGGEALIEVYFLF